MLTFKQLETLIESYGADIKRWPRGRQAEARALLDRSPRARALLSEARALDAELAAASSRLDRKLWPNSGQQDAVARLRARVATRIDAAQPRANPSLERLASAVLLVFPPGRRGWLTLAAAGCMAVLAGLLLGSMFTSPAPSTADNLLIALQPIPIHFPTE
jgi:hypothetical protein